MADDGGGRLPWDHRLIWFPSLYRMYSAAYTEILAMASITFYCGNVDGEECNRTMGVQIRSDWMD